jgi:plastocyanin
MKLKLMSVVGGMFLLTVCSKGDQSAVRAAPPSSPDSPSAESAAAPSDTLTASQSGGGATITGKVKFTGTAPRNRPIDMSEEATCKAKYKTTPPAEENVVAGAANGLGNVFVYVSAGLPAGSKYQAPAAPVVLDQDGCRYQPHVFGIMVGQTLEIRNSDPVLHNIKAIAKKNRPFNVSQPTAGMKTNRTFTAAEVMVNLECNVHGWMKSYAGVRSDPFYAVTGPDGSFSIKGLPPGTYTIEAWHERFGTQTATVTVAGTESKTANITFAAR